MGLRVSQENIELAYMALSEESLTNAQLAATMGVSKEIARMCVVRLREAGRVEEAGMLDVAGAKGVKPMLHRAIPNVEGADMAKGAPRQDSPEYVEHKWDKVLGDMQKQYDMLSKQYSRMSELASTLYRELGETKMATSIQLAHFNDQLTKHLDDLKVLNSQIPANVKTAAKDVAERRDNAFMAIMSELRDILAEMHKGSTGESGGFNTGFIAGWKSHIEHTQETPTVKANPEKVKDFKVLSINDLLES